MRNSILSLAIIALLFTGCGNNNNNEHAHDSEGNHIHKEGVHQHEDGSVHDDHHDAEHHQEEFKVGGDSSAVKTEKENGLSHDDGSQKH